MTRSINSMNSVATTATQFVRMAALSLVVVVPLVVTPWGQDAYSRPKVMILYSLVGIMLGGWLILRASSRRQWNPSTPELALWAFVLVALISSWTTVNPRLTFFGGPGRYEGLLTLLGYVALYFVGVHFFGSKRGVHRLVRLAAIVALPVAAYGVVQLFIPPLFYGEAFTREWYGGLGILRVPSTVGGPVVFGGYLASVIPLLLVLAITSGGVARAVWLSGSCVAIVALALTLTRGAWLAAVLGVIVVAVGVGRLEWRRQLTVSACILAAVVLAAAVLITVVATPGTIGTRVATTVATQSGSVGSRLFIWQRTVDLIRARPLLGWGIETLREIFPYERTSLVRYFGLRPVIIDRAHNDTLQMAVSVGVPGAAAYVAVWLLVIIVGVRLWRREAGADRLLAAGWLGALTGYLVQAQFSFSSVAFTPIIWLLAGAACGWEARPRDDE
jgi:putative inorganic carbon (HCO3(-)) transporter